MTSRRESAIEAAQAALAGITSVAGLTVVRALDRPIVAADCPILAIDAGPGRVRDRGQGIVLWEVGLEIEGWVAAATDAGLGPALNALYAAAVKALYADVTLGGAALSLSEERLATLVDETAGHEPVMGFELAVTIVIETAESTLETAPA